MAITFWDIKTKVWNLLWQSSNSINFNDKVVGDEINIIMEEAWKWKVINKLNPIQIFSCDSVPTRDIYSIFDSIEWTRLTKDYVLGDNELYTNTTNLLSSWYIFINWDIIAYTWKDAEKLTGVSWAKIWHKNTSWIEQLYTLPDNMDKIIKVVDTNNMLEILYENDLWNIGYNILTIWNKYLLKLKGIWKGKSIKINYSKKYTKMVLNTDISPFSDSHTISAIANIAAGVLWLNKWIPNSERILSTGYTWLKLMFDDFNSLFAFVSKKWKVKWYKFNSLR